MNTVTSFQIACTLGSILLWLCTLLFSHLYCQTSLAQWLSETLHSRYWQCFSTQWLPHNRLSTKKMKAKKMSMTCSVYKKASRLILWSCQNGWCGCVTGSLCATEQLPFVCSSLWLWLWLLNNGDVLDIGNGCCYSDDRKCNRGCMCTENCASKTWRY